MGNSILAAAKPVLWTYVASLADWLRPVGTALQTGLEVAKRWATKPSVRASISGVYKEFKSWLAGAFFLFLGLAVSVGANLMAWISTIEPPPGNGTSSSNSSYNDTQRAWRENQIYEMNRANQWAEVRDIHYRRYW